MKCCKVDGDNRLKENDDYGIVYIFYVNRGLVKYPYSDTVSLLSCLSSFPLHEKMQLCKMAIENINKTKFEQKSNSLYKDSILEKLFHEIVKGNPGFQREIRPIDLLAPIFVSPLKDNYRIEKQDGAFILSGLSLSQKVAIKKIEAMSHIRLKISNQDEILDSLDLLNINESSLFPEMEHTSAYLRKK